MGSRLLYKYRGGFTLEALSRGEGATTTDDHGGPLSCVHVGTMEQDVCAASMSGDQRIGHASMG